jgi:TP901 family phage tail tape measure protein
MAERRVSVKFTAEIQGFKQAMAEAAAATEKVKKGAEDSSKAADTSLGRLVQSATKNRDEWEKTGTVLLGIGTAAVAGLGLAGKAAMDWETAWTGVTKTVDGTPEQMDALEASLRGLAKTLPATHEEIAGVAEAAGQLGVKREDIVGFTKTMVDLSETTNLTADDAATGIAQISNVMGTMARDGSKGVERFGATLVALGNAGASTEAEILDMAKRIAGAAKLVGASESDVLALSNAMASLGIESQLGGGVISRVMQRMYEDVKTGGEGLDNLAKVAGVSSKDFAKAFETDPVRAVDSMVKGLGRIKDEGGNVIGTMSDLGIKGTEETGVILRLAGAGDLLSDSLKLGDSAWKSNSALAAEASKRYETTESKVKVAWNNIKDAAIDAGGVLLPIIAGVADSVAGMAKAFGGLPDPVKGAITLLGSVVGVAALGAGAFLTLTPKILDSVQAFNKLAPAGSTARGVLGTATSVAGKAAVAYTALATAAALAAAATEGNRHKTTVEDFNNALIGTAKNGEAAQKAIDAAFKGVLNPDIVSGGTTAVNSFGDALNRVFNSSWQDNASDFGGTIFGQNATTGINAAKDAIGNYDKSLASLASSGNFEDAAAGFQLAAKDADKNHVSIEKLIEQFPQYKDAILANKTANGETQVSQEALTEAMLKGGKASEAASAEGDKAKGSIEGVGGAAADAAPSAEDLAKQLEDVGLRADGSVENLDKFTQALVNAGLLTLSSRDATAKFDEALDGLDVKIRDIMATEQAHGGVLNESKTDLDLLSEAGRAANDVLADMTQKGIGAAEAMAKNGESMPAVQGQLSKTYDAMVTTARGFGLGKDEAENLTRSILHIPPGVDVNTWMSDEAKRMADATKQAVDDIPTSKTVGIHVQYTESGTAIRDRAGDAGMSNMRQVYATGGRLPGFADGGQMPTTGPGTEVTDGFLGISSAGVPMARVDAGEWIVNRGSSNRYNRELAAINAGTFPKLPGYAHGSRAGREYSAQSLGHSPWSAPGGSASSSSGATFGDVIITEQSDPVATWHEFARRAHNLSV